MILEFLPEARAELHEAAEYYQSKQEGLGWRFRNEVFEVCGLLLQQPLMCANGPEAIDASTARCSRTTWPTSSAATGLLLPPWLTGAGIRTTGRHAEARIDTEPSIPPNRRRPLPLGQRSRRRRRTRFAAAAAHLGHSVKHDRWMSADVWRPSLWR